MLYRSQLLSAHQTVYGVVLRKHRLLAYPGSFVTRYLRLSRPHQLHDTDNAQKMSLSEEKIISQFISMLKHEESDVLCSLILKYIYAFMRDWTRIILKNHLSLDRTNSCFDTALTLIKEIINSKPLKEKIKFLTKVIIIKAKNH